MRAGKSPSPGDSENFREQAYATTLDVGGQFISMGADCRAVLDSGDTADITVSKCLGHHSKISQRRGVPRAEAYPARARFKLADWAMYGDGRLGDVRCAADFPLGIAGDRGKRSAFVLKTDIPALLRIGALEALGGRSDFHRNISTLRKQGRSMTLLAWPFLVWRRRSR